MRRRGNCFDNAPIESFWGQRKAYTEGSLVAVGANEPVVPGSDLQEAMKWIRQLEAALGRKTLEC
jgi:transposase InsO family protein